MESIHDYKMVGNRSIVEQAHEVQHMARELELLKCVIPDEFVIGFIIAKLSPSCRGFGTTLKHKRQKISVENLIASLDVEEKARAKDNMEKGNEGHPSANLSRETHMVGTKERISLSMPSLLLPSRRRRKIKQSCLASLVESLATFPKSVWSEQTTKGKRRMSIS